MGIASGRSRSATLIRVGALVRRKQEMHPAESGSAVTPLARHTRARARTSSRVVRFLLTNAARGSC
jgi:hypothetical protein